MQLSNRRLLLTVWNVRIAGVPTRDGSVLLTASWEGCYISNFMDCPIPSSTINRNGVLEPKTGIP
ncbi:MAG: hypothetical protein QW057_09960 [Candidatus Bathyarchaeia archaeon]